MNINELKEYLSALVTMEKEVYLQNQLLYGRKSRMDMLAIPTNYQKPILIKPELADSSDNAPAAFIGLCMGVKFGAIPGAIIAIIAGGPLKSFFGSLLAGAGIGILCVGFIVGMISVYYDSNRKKESLQTYNSELKKRTDEYNIALVQYEQAVKSDAARVQEEQKARSFLRQECKEIKSQLQKSKAALESLYANDVIFPKYRNFVMVSSIYEYIYTGRANTLGEAYNILESEMRLDRIISQLDTIIAHLVDIKNNQYIIYSAIQEANAKLAQINDSSQRIESGIRMLHEQGEALNSRIANLQASSELSVYYNRLNYQQNAYLRRWANHHAQEELLV